MRKQKISYLILLLLFCVAAITGTVFAYMFKRTEYKNNQFIPANVSCEVYEKTDNDSDTSSITEKTSITVKNTGNIPAYIRVRLVSYWVKIAENDTVEITGKASELPELKTAVGWKNGSNDTYYYIKPVEPNEFTTEFLATPIELEDEDGCLQVIEVFAEAIQSLPETTVETSWGVTVENGVITEAN